MQTRIVKQKEKSRDNTTYNKTLVPNPHTDWNTGQDAKHESNLVDNRPTKIAQRALQTMLNSTYCEQVIQRESTEGYNEAKASATKKPLASEQAGQLADQMILKAKDRIEELRPQEEEKQLDDKGGSEKANFEILNLICTKKVLSKVEKVKIEKSKGYNITTDVYDDTGKVMASFQNIYVVNKKRIVKMIAGSNIKSKRAEELPTGLGDEKVRINMNEIIHLQYSIARQALGWRRNTTELNILKEDQGIGLKDLPFVIERGPTPGTDTGNALNFLIQNGAPIENLNLCVIGSPHFSVAFHICRNLGLSMENVDISFHKNNPIITIHL